MGLVVSKGVKSSVCSKTISPQGERDRRRGVLHAENPARAAAYARERVRAGSACGYSSCLVGVSGPGTASGLDSPRYASPKRERWV